MDIVICNNIKKTFGKGATAVQALRGVNLTVKKGEIFLLMGPSGSGKTTLLSVIAGILTQTEGDCVIGGIDLNHMPDYEKTLYRGKHIGFVFQIFNLIPMLTSAENVAVPLILNKWDMKRALEKSKQLLSDVGIADKIDAYPVQLSGGQQQRVAIARAMIHQPDLIVCDEPTSFLDHATGMKVMELLRDIVQKMGSTLIVVTHDPRITEFGQRIVHLEDGRIIETRIN